MNSAKLVLAVTMAVILAAGLMAVTPSLAAIITLQATKDATLNSLNPDKNGGALGDWNIYTQIVSGVTRRYNGLLTFDLNVPEFANPASIKINSVTLRLYTTTPPSGASTLPCTIGVYQLLTDYVEGTRTAWGDPVEDGAVCWNYVAYNTVPWNTPGAMGVGTDRGSARLASLTVIPANVLNSQLHDFTSEAAFVNVVKNRLGQNLNLFAWMEHTPDAENRQVKFWPRTATGSRFEKLIIDYDVIQSGTLTLSAYAAYTDLLKGGTTPITAIVGNAPGTNTDTLDWSLTGGVVTGSGTQLAAGSTVERTGSYTATAYGNPTVPVGAVATNSTLGTPAINSPASANITNINVGLATADTSGNVNAFGTPLIAPVLSNVDLSGLASKTVNSRLTEAVILAGVSALAGNVKHEWRAATATETMLVSDVVNLDSQTGGNAFVLQMSYREEDLGGFLESDLRLGWLNDDVWVNAIAGNSSHAFDQFFLRGWQPGDLLGYHGLDPVNNVVWAVLDHNSQFGVWVIPEPSTFALLACGLFGLLCYAWRKRK